MKGVDMSNIATPSQPEMSGHINISEYGKDLPSVAVKNGPVAIAVKRL
jgi:hypothetical protein